MEKTKKISMRNILIFGLASVVLKMATIFYDPFSSIQFTKSIVLPGLIVLITTLPLALFFWVFWTRVSIPPLLRIGALIAAVGASTQVFAQIYYCYTSLFMMTQIKSMKVATYLCEGFAILLAAGILLIGIAFLQNPNVRFARGGISCIIGGIVGCLTQLLLMSDFLLRCGVNTFTMSAITALLDIATWIPLVIFLATLLSSGSTPTQESDRSQTPEPL